MKWQPPSERTQMIILAPVLIPAAAIIGIALLPMVGLEWAARKWRQHQIAKGTREWFAWYPVKFDGFWEDLPDQWVWLERVRYVNFGRGEWRYLPLGYQSRFEPNTYRGEE